MKLKTLLKSTLTALMLVTVVTSGQSQIIISQYYEGTSNNKWIELTNIGPDVDLTTNPIYLHMIGGKAAKDVTTSTSSLVASFNSGTWTSGSSKLVKNTNSVLPAYATADASHDYLSFNGAFDVVYTSTSDATTAGTAWAARTDMVCEVVGNLTTATSYLDISYVRNQNIVAGNTTFTVAEWTTYALADVDAATTNTTQRLGYHAFGSDKTAPFATFNPAKTATNVLIATPITITFDKAIRKLNDSPIVNTDLISPFVTLKEKNSGNAVDFTATIDDAKKVITIKPNAKLSNSMEYEVAITSVEDEVGNATETLSSTFTTMDASTPFVTNTTILEAKYYAGGNLNVTWTSANITNVKVELFDGAAYSEVVATTPAAEGKCSATIPATSKYGEKYKVRVSNVDGATVNSESSPFTVVAVANTIAGVKTAAKGDIVKYTGKATVTFTRSIAATDKSKAYSQKYIQDETAAILVYDNGAPAFITETYAIGEGISNIEGKIDDFSGLIELVPVATTGEKVTGNPTITPEVRTIVSITSADQCKLVKIENLTISATGNFATGTNYDVAGVANTVFAFRTAFAEADYIGTAIPTTPINVVCLVGQHNDVMQVTPRNLADITTVTGINDNDAVSTKVYPNPFTTDFKINAGKVVRYVTVSNMLGQKVMESAYNEAKITVAASDLKTGVYIVTVKFEDGTSTALRMAKK